MRKIRGEEYLSTGEAARKLGMSKTTFLRWIRDGKLPIPVKVIINKVNRYKFFRKQDICAAEKKILDSSSAVKSNESDKKEIVIPSISKI